MTTPNLSFEKTPVLRKLLHHGPILAEELVHTRVPLGILLEHLGYRHLEILLANILSPFT